MVQWIDKRPVAPAPVGVAGRDYDDAFFVGLDLGQAMDFSALVGLRRRTWRFHGGRQTRSPVYTVRGIKRWPLKTPYTAIVADVVELVGEPPLSGCVLGVDRTGCGQPVIDMLVEAKPKARVTPILITAGFAVSRDGAGWHVPKRELCSETSVVLQMGCLEIPKGLPNAEILGKELLAFRVKITTAGNETMEADWRSRQHDDLVLSLAIACWLGEQTPRRETRPPVPVNVPGWR